MQTWNVIVWKGKRVTIVSFRSHAIWYLSRRSIFTFERTNCWSITLIIIIHYWLKWNRFNDEHSICLYWWCHVFLWWLGNIVRKNYSYYFCLLRIDIYKYIIWQEYLTSFSSQIFLDIDLFFGMVILHIRSWIVNRLFIFKDILCT